VTREECFRQHAIGAARNALHNVASVTDRNPHGFYNGAVGIAYGLMEVGRSLDLEEFISAGRNLITSIAATNETPRHLDIIAGPAGTLLALAALTKEHNLEFPAEYARSLTRHLLAAAVESDRGLSWATLAGKDCPNLNGLAHGVSGIIASLGVTNLQFSDPTIANAIAEGLRYERSWFEPECDNWPDLRTAPVEPPESPYVHTYMNAWCHGAPGIALSRLKLAQLTPDSETRSEANIALKATTEAITKHLAADMGNFSLCHGLAGNADILATAEQITTEPDYRKTARTVGEHGIERFGGAKAPWPSGLTGSQYVPTLMQGLAGTGHFYLRLHAPGNTSSILATGLT
jgi:lantibiotic biosynthesis protein